MINAYVNRTSQWEIWFDGLEYTILPPGAFLTIQSNHQYLASYDTSEDAQNSCDLEMVLDLMECSAG